MKILDVGCGANKHLGAIGLENNPYASADVIHVLAVKNNHPATTADR